MSELIKFGAAGSGTGLPDRVVVWYVVTKTRKEG